MELPVGAFAKHCMTDYPVAGSRHLISPVTGRPDISSFVLFVTEGTNYWEFVGF